MAKFSGSVWTQSSLPLILQLESRNPGCAWAHQPPEPAPQAARPGHRPTLLTGKRPSFRAFQVVFRHRGEERQGSSPLLAPYSHWITHGPLPPERQANKLQTEQLITPRSSPTAARILFLRWKKAGKPAAIGPPSGHPELKEQMRQGGRGPTLAV